MRFFSDFYYTFFPLLMEQFNQEESLRLSNGSMYVIESLFRHPTLCFLVEKIIVYMRMILFFYYNVVVTMYLYITFSKHELSVFEMYSVISWYFLFVLVVPCWLRPIVRFGAEKCKKYFVYYYIVFFALYALSY